MPIDRKPTDVKKDFTPEEQLELATRRFLMLAKQLGFSRSNIELTVEREIKHSMMPTQYPRAESEALLKIAATACADHKKKFLQIAQGLGFSKQIAMIELRNIEQHE